MGPSSSPRPNHPSRQADIAIASESPSAPQRQAPGKKERERIFFFYQWDVLKAEAKLVHGRSHTDAPSLGSGNLPL